MWLAGLQIEGFPAGRPDEHTWLSCTAWISCSRSLKMGSDSRWSLMDRLSRMPNVGALPSACEDVAGTPANVRLPRQAPTWTQAKRVRCTPDRKASAFAPVEGLRAGTSWSQRRPASNHVP